LMVLLESFHQLLGSAAQMAFILRDRLARNFDLTAACEEYFLGVASSFGGQVLDIVISSPQISGSDFYEIGKPGVTIPGCASVGLNAFSTDPDGDARLLQWFGIESHVLETVELAMIADMFLGPQARDDL